MDGHGGNNTPAIGIDLGTTYSCVAVWKHDRIQIIPNDQGNRITPSCVAFVDVERLIDDGAMNKAAMNPANTIFGSILQRWELSLENNERGRGNKKRKGRDETPYDSRGSDPASWKVPQVVSIIACKTCNQVVAMFKKHRSMNQFTIHDLQISNCEVK
ncbi:unnamed protein product [Lactuca saligna]|uniref:Heat shock protein 70 n=1 Tax=Lactuca saligna TaxID=75948 RepID=A0AA35ZZC1_LACSI|nr:unnamed protein product [Lactuca saligna]